MHEPNRAAEHFNERPVLNKTLDSNTFRNFYFLKEELVQFCRENGLPASGGKAEITQRIARFLDTGEIAPASNTKRKTPSPADIQLDAPVESDFVCSEKHRAFFKEHIGKSFSFNVSFQNWLKANAGKTYREAVAAYHQILAEKKKCKTPIDSQFEYNTYIRDFFADNKGKTLADAIKCWNYKKQQPGHNRYEREDLVAIEQKQEH